MVYKWSRPSSPLLKDTKKVKALHCYRCTGGAALSGQHPPPSIATIPCQTASPGNS